MFKIGKEENFRGQFRSIFSLIWNDPSFRQLHPEVKLVLLNLRTSPECNRICLYPLYLEAVSRQTCLPEAAVTSALQVLVETDWISYQDGFIWIRNGLRFDPSFNPDNPYHVQGIRNILKALPKLKIVNDFIEYYGLSDTIPDTTPSSTPSSTRVLRVIRDKGIGIRDKGKGNKNYVRQSETKPVDNSQVKPKTPLNPPKGGNLSFDPFFETFWEEYPSRQGQKRGKRKAFKEWKALKPNQDLFQKILSALKVQKQNYIDCKKHDEFVPEFQDPERWLKNRRWEDEVKLKTWQERVRETPE